MMIDITIATIGRFTKKRAMTYFPSAGDEPDVGVAPGSPDAGAAFATTVVPS
jgi:hypothetical protein